METTKRISIIIPVYNVQAYLRYCVDSVLRQTYSDLEVLLIDDGSTDESGAICDAYAAEDTRVRVLHQANAGQSAARNRGLEMAAGDYILFVDSDDFLLPQMCQTLLALAQEHDAQLVRCGYFSFSDWRRIPDPRPQDSGKVTLYTPRETLQNFICAPYNERKHFIPAVWSTLYVRDLFRDVRFPEGLIYEEGFVLPQVYLLCRTLVHVDKRMYGYFRNTSGTMAAKLSANGLKSLDDWKQIHELVAPQFPELRQPSAQRWVRKYLTTDAQIAQDPQIDPDGDTRRYIRDVLRDSLPYLKTVLGKDDVHEIEAFLAGDKALAAYRTKRARKDALHGKLAALLHRGSRG